MAQPARPTSRTAASRAQHVRETNKTDPDATGYETAVDDQLIEGTHRRMPDYLSKYLLKVQNGYYLPAAYRVVWFRDECPDWAIRTTIIEGGQEAGFATVRAEIVRPDGFVIATGHKTETRTDFPAGWVEKAETGACARALSTAGFGTQFSPELDDLAGVPTIGSPHAAATKSRPAAPPKTTVGPTEIWEGPGLCPNCHAPVGKRHAKPCAG